jgi:alpha-1,6-mannosyltransferase
VKIFDVSEFYSQRGGGVRSHLELKGHVSCQHGHQSIVVAPGPDDIETVVDGGSRIVHLRGPSLPYDPTYHLLWRIDKVRALCARERPDVLEIHSPYLAAAAALSVSRAHFGVRTFMWHADFIDTYLRPAIEKSTSHALADVALAPVWAMVRGIAHRCDATIVAAKWQVDKLTAHGLPRVVLAPFGVEKSIFSPRARNEEARRALTEGLAADGPSARVMLGIGRFAIEKRWDVVLDAFAFLRARGVNAVLVLFGDGPERAAMQARVTGFPSEIARSVRFLGFERDRGRLAAALASADLLLHGCSFETFGLGVAEAKSAGLPLVAPDAGGAAELVDESCGAVYPAGDANGCAAAAERLLARDPGELRLAAEEAAKLVPTVDDHFTRVFALYEDLLLARRDGAKGTSAPQWSKR